LADVLAEGFAVFVDHPNVGGDVAHAALGAEQAEALFDEGQIHVEVAALGAGVERRAVGGPGLDEVGGHVVLGAAEMLEFDIGRIADHAVEAAVAENLGESRVPVEGIDALAFVAIGLVEERLVAFAVEGGEVGTDEAVAASDVRVERAERLAGRGGVEPEGEFGDLDRLLIDIHAVDIVGEDGADDRILIEEAAASLDAFLFGDDPAVFVHQAVECLDEEGPGAAGRVDDPQVIKAEAVIIEELDPCAGHAGDAAAVGLIGPVFRDGRIVERWQFLKTQPGLDVVKARAEGLIDDHANNPFRRVIDTVGFSFAEAVDRDAAVGLGLHDFEFGDGLLENAAEGVEADGAFASRGAEAEVVGG